MILVSFETSCDETSVSVIINGKIISNTVYSQLEHEKYGGVVPELASRAHMQKIVPLFYQSIHDAKISIDNIQAVAFTQSPGLIGSLIVGACFAKTFAHAKNLPLIGVNHMEAHILAACIDREDSVFPFISLVVSGGHTQLTVCKSYTEFEIIGSTKDDAVGEAFDKIAKMLNIGYPGGPRLDKLAQSGTPKYQFNVSSIGALDFSYSGIKTQVLYFLQKEMAVNPNFVQENLQDLCASVQKALVDSLLKKLKKAVKETGIRKVSLAGGVSANSLLRSQFLELSKIHGWEPMLPEFQYCTDNAGMIAFAGYHQLLAGLNSEYSIAPSSN